MEQARVIIEVTAGILLGTPMPEYTKRFVITSKEWQDAEKDKELPYVTQATLLATRNGQAQGYAAWLMMQPDYLNWVRTDWIWL